MATLNFGVRSMAPMLTATCVGADAAAPVEPAPAVLHAEYPVAEQLVVVAAGWQTVVQLVGQYGVHSCRQFWPANCVVHTGREVAHTEAVPWLPSSASSPPPPQEATSAAMAMAVVALFCRMVGSSFVLL